LSRPEPFAFTTGRWYNRYDRETDRYAKAPAYREGFTYDQFAYGSDTPEDFLPGDGTPVQVSLICARQTNLLVIDVDHPEQLAASATGRLVSWADALSTRGTHFHIGADMRGAPEEAWPVQGKTAWGDIKSNGFAAAPGSIHYSGEPYAPAAADWAGRLVPWTPELLAALEADKSALAVAKRAEWGIATGTHLPDGAYLYSSGYTGGFWKEIPDGGLKHDDELKDLLWDMHVEYGKDEQECREQWFRLAGALGKPWTEKDFARHWKRVPARRLERLEQDDATRFWEDFGLKMPEPQWQQAAREQQEEYEQRQVPAGTQGTGFGPPTPPQADGPYEYPGDGISWFHYYLGTGVFDAGRPTDAGNAEAVLRRARYALRHDEEADTWLKRTAGRWVQDADAAKEAVTALGRLLPEGCADPVKAMDLDPETDGAAISALKVQAKNYERFGTSSVVNGIAAMMKNIARARSEPWMTVRDSSVDAEPEILWAGGVPWDLRASANGPVRSARADRNEPHLHSAACVPDASVDTPLWDALMRAVWVDAGGEADPRLAAWAVLVLSVGVTGYPKKVVPLLKGGKDRGKSTVIDAVADVLGTYFRPLNEKILESGASTHDTVLMELKGTRLTFLDEGIQRGKVATARFKRLVGGSSITANRMRQDPVTFRPTHTLAITLNPEESFSFEDPAVDARIRLLPCDGNAEQVIAVAQRFDYFHSREWLDERPGVLAKLMSAAAYMLADSHAVDKDRAPASVVMAEQGAKDEEDDVLRWFLEATEDCPGGYPSRELYLHFKSWTEETKTDRSPVPTETRWGRRMNELVPEDHPDGKRLTTARNTILRRRRPVQPGGFQGSGGLGDSGYAQRNPQSPGVAETNSPVVIHRSGTVDHGQPPRTDPPEQPNRPANSPNPLTRDVSSFSDSSDSSDSYTHSTTKKKTPPPSPTANGTGKTIRVSEPSAECQLAPGSGDPVAAVKSLPAETGENGKIRENGDSPPKAKNPRKTLTDEERAERVRARKEKLARERADARRDKIAELGGPLVQLPAIVLRDQSILPCTPAQARAWLEPMLGELSVDVEHSGYPAQHKDYRLRLVQLGDEHSAVVLDPSDPEQAEVARNALRAAQVLHAHSALADLIPLEREGLGDAAMWDRMRDSVLLAKLSDPSLCDSDEAGLKALAKALLGPDYALSWKAEELKNQIFAAGGWLIECEVTTPVERSGWAMVPLCESFIRYSAADVMDCAAVWRTLMERNS
jgi:phage/plasmid-associated DNA primase